MHRAEKNKNLKNNIRYLIKSRGETQVSLCVASGLTRTTIYNILEGKVSNVQHSTVRKISDFFGVSYEEIEQVNFEAKEVLDRSASVEGNMNPAAVPVIKEGRLICCLDKTIGELVTCFPLTYYFGLAHNMLAVVLERQHCASYRVGDVLVVHKGYVTQDGDHVAYDTESSRISIVSGECIDTSGLCVIGRIVEERFNDLSL